MAWNTPTVTTTRGRHVRHTYITATATLEGNTVITTDITFPLGTFAGTIMGESNGGTATDITTLSMYWVGPTGHGTSDLAIYINALTLSSDPDFFELESVFENLDAPVAGKFYAPVVCPAGTPETSIVRLRVSSDNAAQTSETVEVHIGLLSYVLEA